MKKVFGFILLFWFICSVFLLVVAPIELYKTIEARNWKAVDVKIVSHQIKEVSNEYYSDIRILDLESGKKSQSVSVRYGDIALSLIVVNRLCRSTLYADKKKYPKGIIVKAYKNQNESMYVLEQNSINLMLVVLVIAAIYPGVTVWSVVTKQKE